MTKFAERLKERRGSRSQYEMAAWLGVSQASYAYWETGARQPKLDDFARICKRLDVTADWLLGLENDAPRPDPTLADRLTVLKSQAEKMTADMVRINRELGNIQARAKT